MNLLPTFKIWPECLPLICSRASSPLSRRATLIRPTVSGHHQTACLSRPGCRRAAKTRQGPLPTSDLSRPYHGRRITRTGRPSRETVWFASSLRPAGRATRHSNALRMPEQVAQSMRRQGRSQLEVFRKSLAPMVSTSCPSVRRPPAGRAHGPGRPRQPRHSGVSASRALTGVKFDIREAIGAGAVAVPRGASSRSAAGAVGAS